MLRPLGFWPTYQSLRETAALRKGLEFLMPQDNVNSRLKASHTTWPFFKALHFWTAGEGKYLPTHPPNHSLLTILQSCLIVINDVLCFTFPFSSLVDIGQFGDVCSLRINDFGKSMCVEQPWGDGLVFFVAPLPEAILSLNNYYSFPLAPPFKILLLSSSSPLL